jgi:hypothetical protein
MTRFPGFYVLEVPKLEAFHRPAVPELPLALRVSPTTYPIAGGNTIIRWHTRFCGNAKNNSITWTGPAMQNFCANSETFQGFSSPTLLAQLVATTNTR